MFTAMVLNTVMATIGRKNTFMIGLALCVRIFRILGFGVGQTFLVARSIGGESDIFIDNMLWVNSIQYCDQR